MDVGKGREQERKLEGQASLQKCNPLAVAIDKPYVGIEIVFNSLTILYSALVKLRTML